MATWNLYNTYIYINYINTHQEWTRIFLHTLLERADHQYLNDQHLACEVRVGMYEVLTRSGLTFTYKMIQEIISMLRADSVYLHNFGVDSDIYKDNKSETEAKTNSGHRACLLLACAELAQRPLLACRVSTQTQTHTHRHNFSTKGRPKFSYTLYC